MDFIEKQYQNKNFENAASGYAYNGQLFLEQDHRTYYGRGNIGQMFSSKQSSLHFGYEIYFSDTERGILNGKYVFAEKDYEFSLIYDTESFLIINNVIIGKIYLCSLSSKIYQIYKLVDSSST